MGIKNQVKIGEYAIAEDENGSFHVMKIFDNTKGALRDISEQIGFEYDGNWTTRQFGAKLINELNGQKSPSTGVVYAVCSPYMVYRNNNGSIVVFKHYQNTIEGLREAAKTIGVEYDDKPTTRQLGTRIIKRAVEACNEEQ